MVTGKSKNMRDLDPPSKATNPQFGVTAAAATAIPQAATGSIKNPNFGMLGHSGPVPVVKAITKTAAHEVANERTPLKHS